MMTVKEQKRTEIENVMIKYYLALGLNSSVSILSAKGQTTSVPFGHLHLPKTDLETLNTDFSLCKTGAY